MTVNKSRNELTVVTLDSGDGIAPEILTPTVQILEKACELNNIHLTVLPLAYGRLAMAAGEKPLPDEIFSAGETHGFVIKTPSSTLPDQPGGSFNVAYRRDADLYAGIRWVRPLMPSRATLPDTSVVVVRENIGGNYGGKEFTYRLPTKGEFAFGSRKISRRDVERTQSLMFRCAAEEVFPDAGNEVYVHHKSNILPVTEGMRLACAKALSAEYPEIPFQSPHVDFGAMGIASWRKARGYHEYENLMGDVLSECWCGRTGGITLQGSVNVGDGIVVAETAGGTAPDIAGKGIANPTGLIDGVVSALYMAEVSGAPIAGDIARSIAATIESALKKTLEAARPDELTGDLGGTANTETFTRAILQNMEVSAS